MTVTTTGAGAVTGHVFRLPDLGEGLTEAEILEWRVAVGDVVTVDQIVVEVETAKAAVDVPVPVAGTVVRLHGTPGTVLEVGQPLLTVAPPDEPGGPAAARPSGERRSPAAPDGDGDGSDHDRYREEERAGSGNVLIGYGTRAGHGSRRRAARRAARADALARASAPAGPGAVGAGASAPAAAVGPAERAAEPRTVAAPVAPLADDVDGLAAAARRADRTGTGAEAPRVISPVVRRLAREHGLDLAALVPSGPGGVLLRRDVDAAIDALTGRDGTAVTAGTAAVAVSGAAGTPHEPAGSDPRTVTPGGTPAADGTEGTVAGAPDRAAEPVRIPLRGLRRTVADKLARSRREIPDATTWVDVDATPLMELKDDLRRACPDQGVGVLALLARICVAGLHRYPQLNAYVDTDRAEIVQLPWVNLGFAAQTDRGLVVPVVHDAHRLTLAELAERLRELTRRAREGTLTPHDLTGGTFTLNNYGVFGVDGSTPIINHPEAGLLGVGRIVDRPWGVDGELRLRKVAQLSFTFDHRVCDGGVAGGFLRFVADCVERPQVLITNL